MKNILHGGVWLLVLCLYFFSCKKDSFVNDASAILYTSRDTLFFDTVFAGRGSVTQSFKIFNGNDRKLHLKRIRLAGGDNSPFKININGIAAAEENDVVIAANDSLYVFVQVNVDPGASSLPFIVSDSIQIDFNGNTRFVQLQAYGRNAIFLKNTVISGRVNWTNQLPYVISGGINIHSGATLQIAAGTQIYLHADAAMRIDGRLIVNGTKDERVVFTGDRLDEGYRDLPGSWPGILFTETSNGNQLNFATIKNAYQAITIRGMDNTGVPKLVLSHSIIDNSFAAGIAATGTEIHADNNLISNCGSNIVLRYGGDYRFVHCTVVSYGNSFIDHVNPALQVNDHNPDNATQTAPLRAFFQNSIFWGDYGNVPNEIVVERKGNNVFGVNFDHIIYKATEVPVNASFNASLLNVPPLFDSINTFRNFYDFHFTKQPSPAIDAGTPGPSAYDLDGKPRDALPDIGCYEQ